MSEDIPELPTKESFWKEHVKKAQVFKGSDLEYCRLNGLKPSTFGGYKRKFGYVKSPKFKASNPKPFKKLSVITPKELSVNSPEWVARFLKEFLA